MEVRAIMLTDSSFQDAFRSGNLPSLYTFNCELLT